MQVFKPEVVAYPFKATLDEAAALLGEAGLAGILSQYGVTRESLEDQLAWVSLEFVESFFTAVAEAAKEPKFAERAATRSMSARYIGPIYPLFVALGTPLFTYQQLPKATRRLSKISRWEAVESRPGFVRLVLTPTANAATETSDIMCRFRIQQLVRIPTLFGLPTATVAHPKCTQRGDNACVYDVSWREAPLRRHGLMGAFVGVVLASVLGWLASAPEWHTLASVAGFAVGGWAMGRAWTFRRVLSERQQDIDEHNESLSRVVRSNEERYADLLEAKASVDLKVEQRTNELRLATDQLSVTLNQVRELDRAKTDFFNNVSHELRSPLTLILAPLEELIAGRHPPGGEGVAFQSMHRNATRLLRLINQLLDLAKIDAGEMKLASVSTDLSVFLPTVVSGFSAAAERKGLKLECLVPGGMSPLVIDQTWIESAVTNLAANAVRLTPTGSTVRLEVSDQGSDVLISVSDQGPGIPQEDQERIFERFAQGDSGKRVIGGTGIGLALVREAARLHGGSVTLVSAPGKGATFTLRIPRRSQSFVDTRLAPSGVPARPASLVIDEVKPDSGGSERPAPTHNAPFAFVVEDNPELREFIADVLATRYRVKSFGLASEAVSAARALKPDVIVSDVAMPEMNGFELCRALRASQETRAIPIVLVTARTDVSSILEGFDAGASDYVLKPFHGRELLARVDVHVRLRRMVQEFALRERHTMLGVLAASVAHQVRNPLTTLVSGLPAMRARLVGNLAPSTFELIDMMIDCAARIERLTTDLMDLSHIDREARTAFRPSDGLRAAVRLINGRLGPDVMLEANIEDCPPIEGRGGDMNHVFMNLLDNAIRAVESRGTVRVDAVPRNGYYSVRVGDSGPGIDEETAKQIFEPFFTTRKAGEGTGLGLAIARQVIQQFGGMIELGRSELGGALFRVDIPLTRHSSVPRSAGPSAS
jgi:signal transduction histidine kinase